jgi:hypothetical protein
MQKILDFFPKMVLGPLLVIVGIIYFYVQDPPHTVCDVQFEIFKKEAEKYLYGYTKKGITLKANYIKDLDNCRNSNSIGGCYGWSEELKKIIKLTRNLPLECRDRLEELDPLLKYYSSSLRIYSQISWNDSEVIRKQLFHWLDREDLIVFCRLKSEYMRLVGAPAYRGLEVALFNELITLKKLPKEEVWRRTILSQNCAEF